MNRTEFILVTAIVLFVAFALGWLAHWVVNRFIRIADTDMGEVDRLAAALHEAEEMRDQAITYLQERETALNRQIVQTEAELQAAMDGLRAARQEAEELRRRIAGR